MRAAPPVETIAALRGGWWWAACGLWLCCLLCFAIWLAWHWDGLAAPVFLAELPLLLLISLLAVGTLAAAATLLWHAHQEPMRLSWNGSQWVCVPLAADRLSVPTDAPSGNVDLMLDLGDAMLLRWCATAPAARRVVWLPVSREHADAWHGLRVALHLPTPITPFEPGAAA